MNGQLRYVIESRKSATGMAEELVIDVNAVTPRQKESSEVSLKPAGELVYRVKELEELVADALEDIFNAKSQEDWGKSKSK